MAQPIKATVSEDAQESNYVRLSAAETDTQQPWKFNLMAPPTQWNLDTADQALVNHGYRRTDQWTYSTDGDRSWSATVEKVGQQTVSTSGWGAHTSALQAATAGHARPVGRMLGNSSGAGSETPAHTQPAPAITHDRGAGYEI
ncbi:hypothetical protein [Rhodococcus sp. NPDC058481]|uniref:hypothetical protein n=1 Tax=unclassified Rhodococcus (in: high G+C Gram-positive bacteria) TaxID=192944 RepID=UPI00364DC4E2